MADRVDLDAVNRMLGPIAVEAGADANSDVYFEVTIRPELLDQAGRDHDRAPTRYKRGRCILFDLEHGTVGLYARDPE